MRKQQIKQCFIHIIVLFIIISSVSYYLDINCAPKIFGDEYGYWAAGAFFAGIDWSDITAINEYYGWGYGIVLGLILKLPIDAMVCYQVSIIVNAVFIFVAYLFAYKLVKEFLNDWNSVACSITALALVVFPSAIYYAQYSVSEVFLCMLFWIITYLEWKIINRQTVFEKIMLVLLCAMMFATHMRTIGIVIVALLTILLTEFRVRDNVKKNVLRLVFFLLIALVFLVAVLLVKSIFQNSYVINDVGLRNSNTVAGQVGKLQTLFTLKGIESVYNNFIGRVYSLGMNTFLLGFIGIGLGIKKIYYNIKVEKKCLGMDLWFMCVFTGLLSLMGISAVYMIGAEFTRIDILTYSRYHEFAVGPIMLFAIIYLNEMVFKSYGKKMFLILASIAIIITKYITYVQNFETSISNLFINTPFLFWGYKQTEDVNTMYLMVLVVVLVLLCTLFVLLKCFKKYGVVVFSTIIILFSLFQSKFIYENGCLNWSTKELQSTVETLNYIKENGYEEELIFLADDNSLLVDQLQFLLKEYEIHVDVLENIENKNNSIIISTDSYQNNELLLEYGFDVLYENGRLKLWKEKD